MNKYGYKLNLIKMAYLLSKIFVTLCIVAIATSQLPSPDASWSSFQVKSCCPAGYNEIGNYCVKCTAPLFWDAISGKCQSCPQGHFYNPTFNRCDCTVPCEAPRQINPANNQCECPADQKGNRRVWSASDKSCQCPPELPLWNGKYCVVCPAGTEFDSKEKQCYHCPDGFIRDYNSHACVPGL